MKPCDDILSHIVIHLEKKDFDNLVKAVPGCNLAYLELQRFRTLEKTMMERHNMDMMEMYMKLEKYGLLDVSLPFIEKMFRSVKLLTLVIRLHISKCYTIYDNLTSEVIHNTHFPSRKTI